MADTAIDTEQLWNSLPGRTPLPSAPDMLAPPVTPQVTLPPGLPQGTPPQAIKTAPTPMPLPPAPAAAAPEFDDDRDLKTWGEEEAKAFSPTNVRSHRGDMRFISGEPPKGGSLEEHPEYSKFEQMNELVTKIANPKQRREADTYVKAMERRLRRETENSGKAASKAFFDKERSELQRADGSGVRATQAPEINAIVDNYVGTRKAKLEEMVKKGGPKERQEAERYLVSSPFTTMGDDERRNTARSLLRLNADMDASDATRLIYDLATPPARGQKGKNNFVGRAAADYLPKGVDVLGNHILETGYGMVRVPPNTYKLINAARLKGYNEMVKYEKQLAETRKKEEDPGMISQAVDWTRKQLK